MNDPLANARSGKTTLTAEFAAEHLSALDTLALIDEIERLRQENASLKAEIDSRAQLEAYESEYEKRSHALHPERG
jgi:hypothetical protein